MSGEVKFLDLTALHQPLRAQLDDAWNGAVSTSGFIGGPAVATFEQRWARYCGVEHAVGVSNGTDAIELILAGLDIGPGDDVIVPANTFVATAEAVHNVGATPVFADVDRASLLITADHIETVLTDRTAAIIVVHLYGQIPEMGPIKALADGRGIPLIEDAAQAHGATHNGVKAGAFGRAASFSFYPGKNLGAFGDAGAVVTNDPDLADTVQRLANHGRGDHLSHVLRGRNCRMDALQAAILDIKLDHLDAWNAKRVEFHRLYTELLAGSQVEMLATVDGSQSVHHLEVARVDDRDGIRGELSEAGIQTGIHYALPCHQHDAFAAFATGGLTVVEQAAPRLMSLPMHPTLEPEEVKRSAYTLLEAVSRR